MKIEHIALLGLGVLAISRLARSEGTTTQPDSLASTPAIPTTTMTPVAVDIITSPTAVSLQESLARQSGSPQTPDMTAKELTAWFQAQKQKLLPITNQLSSLMHDIGYADKYATDRTYVANLQNQYDVLKAKYEEVYNPVINYYNQQRALLIAQRR